LNATGRALLVLSLCACRSTDPAFLDTEGRPLEELAPVLYTVAIAPIDLAGLQLAGPGGGESSLQFSMRPDELQQDLVGVLARLNSASAVIAVGTDDVAEARARRADLLVRPRLRSPASLSSSGISSNGFLTAVLWITTWVGGFFVKDSSYTANLAVEFDIVNPYEGVKIDSVPASSADVDLRFFDRNRFVSWGTLLSLVVPPFWTVDQKQRTSESLSRIASARLAARLARYLKEDLGTTERDFLGEVRLLAPKNGAQVGGVASLNGKVIAREAITSLAVYLNDSAAPAFEMNVTTLPSVAEQRVGNVYQVFLERDLPLGPGRNFVALEIGISGRLTSRTLVVYNGEEASSP